MAPPHLRPHPTGQSDYRRRAAEAASSAADRPGTVGSSRMGSIHEPRLSHGQCDSHQSTELDFRLACSQLFDACPYTTSTRRSCYTSFSDRGASLLRPAWRWRAYSPRTARDGAKLPGCLPGAISGLPLRPPLRHRQRCCYCAFYVGRTRLEKVNQRKVDTKRGTSHVLRLPVVSQPTGPGLGTSVACAQATKDNSTGQRGIGCPKGNVVNGIKFGPREVNRLK